MRGIEGTLPPRTLLQIVAQKPPHVNIEGIDVGLDRLAVLGREVGNETCEQTALARCSRAIPLDPFTAHR